RAESPFIGVQDLGERAALARGELEALAAAGALSSLGGHRHHAYWGVAGFERALPMAPVARRDAAVPLLRAPTEGQDIVADYGSIGLTLGRHPMALLRERFAAAGTLTAAGLATCQPGSRVSVAGLVTSRQRPATASGVTFVTIEDETGFVNVIVWRELGRRQRRELVQAPLLQVHGTLQREAGVVHVVARKLADRSLLLGALPTRSRDFR
ncbi:MAG: error-prone polymerase, partial [Pseudomonadota bacterium]